VENFLRAGVNRCGPDDKFKRKVESFRGFEGLLKQADDDEDVNHR
jgi:hypothetical protein